MSRYQRLRIPGACVFFTVCLAERGSALLLREVVALRAAVRATMAERPFEILAWVVLGDHMHCVWKMPEGDCDYSVRWRMIKTRFSMGLPKGNVRASHERRLERGIWQRRFWEHHLRSQSDVNAAIRYCWINPVRHGLVETPEDWPYSSVHRDRRVTQRAV